ncbi:MAG: aryl-sulfate sulfotransferase [Verrucomicrobiales bacterium]|nr:aryl-sulfate sulfotransferase [Verrucomicrobiales bacterium]
MTFRLFSLLFAGITARVGLTELAESAPLPVENEALHDGAILMAPMSDRRTYLLGPDNEPIHSWDSDYLPGRSAYLMDDGSIIRAGRGRPPSAFRRAGGSGGRIQRISWDGELLWDYMCIFENRLAHHDIEPLPNGNVLVLAWELITAPEAEQLGRDPKKLKKEGVWNEVVLEIKPRGLKDGDVVWRWSAADHIIQDFNDQLPNYGKISDHPGRIDINHVTRDDPDWIHFNSIDYNAELDQILLSAHAFSEIWIIDHSTTTGEAKTNRGGRQGKGGELLYRWGNPQAHGLDRNHKRLLYRQHDAQWIEDGHPGAGNIILFNNGWTRPVVEYSTIEEMTPALNGTYTMSPGNACPPEKVAWSYAAPNKMDFFSRRISGVQRLPNGNTLICSGATGILFEINSAGEQLWQYQNPFGIRRGAPRLPSDQSTPPTSTAGNEARPAPGGPGAGADNAPATPAGAAPFGRHAVFKVKWYPADHPAFEGRFEE